MVDRCLNYSVIQWGSSLWFKPRTALVQGFGRACSQAGYHSCALTPMFRGKGPYPLRGLRSGPSTASAELDEPLWQQVRILVARSVLERDPRGLHPYILMRGMERGSCCPHFANRPGHLYNDEERQELWIPDFPARLSHAVDIIDEAVGVGPLRGSPHVRELLAAIEDMVPGEGVDSSDQPFEFYVAGGFIVSLILGHGAYQDIDVWFAPTPGQNNSHMIAWGQPGHPVNVLMVNYPRQFIETFDLDICKCAIKCSVVNQQREYQFMLTRSCALAWMNTCVHMHSVHPAIAQARRLASRLHKYAQRRLDIDTWEQHTLSETGASDGIHGTSDVQDGAGRHYVGVSAERARGMPSDQGEVRSMWFIGVRGGGVVFCALRLLPVPWAPVHTALEPVRCKPAVVHPCHRAHMTFDSMAFSGGEVHWLVRGLAGCPLLVCLPGVGCIWSNLVVPEWLLDRAALSEQDVVQEIERFLPRFEHHGAETTACAFSRADAVYGIQCSQPALPMSIVSDWRLAPQNDYGGEGQGPQRRMMYVETQGMGRLRTAMFCVQDMQPHNQCVHHWGLQSPLLIF